MSILLFVNLKGGVAKTTNAVAVAECLADSGYRTLLIDADHQCTSSELLLGESRMLKCEKKEITLHDLLAAMLDDEFKPEQIPYHAVKNVSDLFLTVYSGIFLQNRELRDHTGGVAPGAVSPQGADGSTC
jgi:chromosome partitioning protein